MLRSFRPSLAYAFAPVVAISVLHQAACFGDNESTSSIAAELPVVTAILGPADVDEDAASNFELHVQGRPDETLTVNVGASVGAVTPAVQELQTDSAGEATLVVKYAAEGRSGAAELTAQVSRLATSGPPTSKALTVHTVERIGDAAAVGSTSQQIAGVLIAYPVSLATERVVRKLGVFAPAQIPPATVDVQLGLYATESASSVRALAKATAKLVAGANEIEIPAQTLPAGTYWFVIAYRGSPLIYRDPDVAVSVRYKTGYDYATGLEEVISELSPSNGNYYKRSLYLVVRQ